MKYIVLLIIVAVAFFFMRNANNSKVAIKNNAIGDDFLIKNRTVEGVVETDTGLQYQVLEQGEGTEHPTAGSKVTVHYSGTLLDGTVFDSSIERGEPISFGLRQVISGWTEGVQLMVVGDKFRFFIPSNLAYGNRAAGKIEPGSLLTFEVTLIAIQ